MGKDNEAFVAVRAGDMARLKTLLDEDPTLVDSRSELGMSLLLEACYRQHPDMAEMLRDRLTRLDVFESAAVGDEQRLSALLSESPELATSWTPDGFTPLHLACYFGQLAQVEVLLHHGVDSEAESRNPMRLRPLHAAVAGSHTAVVRTLLANGADPVAAQSGGWTALHTAAKRGNVELMKVLLDGGANPLAVSTDGRTPVDLAEKAEQKSAVALLHECTRQPA